MASLRYHAGRMVLYEEKPTVWRVKIKTKKFVFIVKDVGVAPLKLSIYAENKTKAMQYAKARWNDCKLELFNDK